LSTNVLLEYDDVTKRAEILKKSKFSQAQIEDVLDLLALLAHKHEIYFRLRPNLTDEKDNLFVECAFASNSSYIITSNIRDFERGELKGFGFQLVTPKQFYQQWRIDHE
jgi:predicted nucleic acid-binding protein